MDDRPTAWNSTLRVPRERMRRTAPPDRNAPLPAVNRKRRTRLLGEQYGPHADAVRCMPCVACVAAGTPQTTRTVAAHVVKTRGAGGKARDLAPLCVLHEDEYHRLGRWTFRVRYGLDLTRIALLASGERPPEFHTRESYRELRNEDPWIEEWREHGGGP